MAENMKNMRAYVKENLDIPLYTMLPKGGRKNCLKNKGESIHTYKSKDSPPYHPLVEK